MIAHQRNDTSETDTNNLNRIKWWAIYKWNRLQFLFVVKATTLEPEISNSYPQIKCTEASCHICISQRPVIMKNLASELRICRQNFDISCFKVAAFTIKRNWSQFFLHFCSFIK